MADTGTDAVHAPTPTLTPPGWRQLKPNDLVQTSLGRYRVTRLTDTCVYGVLVMVWRGAWQAPLAKMREEELHLMQGRWERAGRAL